MDSTARRYSMVPFACDDCGRPAHCSIAGGKGGHTMLCRDCAGSRGYPKGMIEESEEIMDRSSSLTRHAFRAARWSGLDGTPRCAECGKSVGQCAVTPRTAARTDAPLLDPTDIEAQGGHVASMDYPELSEILAERPDHIGAKTAGVRVAISPKDIREQRERSTKPQRRPKSADDPFPEFDSTGEALAEGTGGGLWNRVVGPAVNRFEKAMPGAARPTGESRSTDWCRFRRDSHCWYPKDMDEQATAEAGYPVWIPVDRGPCWRVNWADQKSCTMAEAGPHSREKYVQPDATVSWEDGGQRIPGRESARQDLPNGYTVEEYNPDDPDDGFLISSPGGHPMQRVPSIEYARQLIEKITNVPQRTGGWAEVQAKAASITAEGHVRIISKADNVVTAEVKGDHGTYLSTITRVPGSKQTAIWSCSCPWSTYAWARSGRWKKLEGRMCAHALATVYTMQKQEMFGGEITEQSATPIWRNEPLITEQPREAPGPWRVDKAAALLEHLSALEWQRARLLTSTAIDPQDRLSWVTGISTAASVARVELSALQAGDDIEVTALGRFEAQFWAKVRGRLCRVLHLIKSTHEAEVEGIGKVPIHELTYSRWDPTANLGKFGSIPDDGKFHINGPWYHAAESEAREELGTPTMGRADLDNLLIEVLTAAGIPHADDAYTFPSREQASMIGWDTEVGLTPVVFMASNMWDKLTLLHEAAHHIVAFKNGTMGKVNESTEASHSDLWASTFLALLRKYLPAYAAFIEPQWKLRRSTASLDAPEGDFTHAGLVIKALDSGRVLMTQRTPYHNDEDETFGAWEFPGGGIEDGENPLQAALREFKEETGLDLPEGYRVDDYAPNGGYVAIHVSVPHETWTTGVELLPMETMGIGWFEPDHIQGELPTRPEIEETDWDLVAEAAHDDPEGPEAVLHDEPEPALPSTDGGSINGDNETSDWPTSFGGDEAPQVGEDSTPWEEADSIHMMSGVAPGDPRLAWLLEGQADDDSLDIAKAAKAWLAKTAVKDFSPAEQKKIIDEGDSVRAGNLDRLQLEGTHYQSIDDAVEDDLFL